ncbi:hypothetical protein, partial [Enterococcus hirae]|uniref:hypothetical protein n=1 Tax=Enterococcus hirae TaxID=1354 RepID=UPI00136D48CF
PDDGQFGAGSFWEPPCNEWPANHLANLRPAVVVPEVAQPAQPAEPAEARLWLGTVTTFDGTRHNDMILQGPRRPDGLSIFYDSLPWGAVSEGSVSDLRPAVVVPQREDEDEAEPESVRLAHILRESLAGWATVPLWRAEEAVRAVLAAQRPAAPAGDDGRVSVPRVVLQEWARALKELQPVIPMSDEPWRTLDEMARDAAEVVRALAARDEDGGAGR